MVYQSIPLRLIYTVFHSRPRVLNWRRIRPSTIGWIWSISFSLVSWCCGSHCSMSISTCTTHFRNWMAPISDEIGVRLIECTKLYMKIHENCCFFDDPSGWDPMAAIFRVGRRSWKQGPHLSGRPFSTTAATPA